MGIDGVLAGLVYVEDQIREDAAHVVQSLTSQGINVYLLSGDKKSSAEYVASVVGIPKDQVLRILFSIGFESPSLPSDFATCKPEIDMCRCSMELSLMRKVNL